MRQPQRRGVQRHPPHPARVRNRPAVHRPVVHALATQWRSRLAEVDAHLMSAARLQAALDQRELTQLLDDADVRDGALSLTLLDAAAPPVTAVAHQPRLDAARGGTATDDGEIEPLDRVRAELPPEVPLSLR